MHFLLVIDLWSLLLVPTAPSFGVLVKWILREFKKDRVYFKHFWIINYFLKQCICLYALWVKIVDLPVFEALRKLGVILAFPKYLWLGIMHDEETPKLNCWLTDELRNWTGTEMWIKKTFSLYSGVWIICGCLTLPSLWINLLVMKQMRVHGVEYEDG